LTKVRFPDFPLQTRADSDPQARQNRNPGKPETELKEFEAVSCSLYLLGPLADFQILAEHQAKGLEEQALEADVAKKTKAAKRRAAKRGAATGTASAAPVASRGSASAETPVRAERPKRGQLFPSGDRGPY
jgi:hypothetical protein